MNVTFDEEAPKASLQQRLTEMGAQRFPCRPRLLPVEGTPKLVGIEAGGLRTCGLTTDGRHYCWARSKARSDSKGTTRPTLIVS